MNLEIFLYESTNTFSKVTCTVRYCKTLPAAQQSEKENLCDLWSQIKNHNKKTP